MSKTVSSPHQPNGVLRYQRQLRGWSLRRVADEISTLCIQRSGKRPGINSDMVGEWERGVKKPSPFYQEMLCLLYGCTADKLHFLTPAIPETSPVGENRDMKRRDLLHLLSVAGGALAVSFPVDWDRIGDALDRPSRTDKTVIEDLAAINHRFWSLYLAASSKSSLLDGVTGQLKTLVQFLNEPHTRQGHQQICALASDLAQLAGEIHFDRLEPDLASLCYVFAASAAKEAQAYDLWSCSLIRHAFLPLYDHHYGEALPLLQEARRLAGRGNSQLPTRFWAAAVEAEAEAGIGHLSNCQNSLDFAAGVLDFSEKPPAWVRFDGARLPALRGACYTRLAQPALATSALQEALVQFDTPGRKRGMVLLDLATAATQSQDIEQACSYLDQVATLVAQNTSAFLKTGIVTVRCQLQPFASSAAVKAIDQRLPALI